MNTCLSDVVCDVATCDVIKNKVLRCAGHVGHLLFLPLSITFIINKNNVTTSPINVYRGFMRDVIVTLSLFRLFGSLHSYLSLHLYRRLPACLAVPVPWFVPKLITPNF